VDIVYDIFFRKPKNLSHLTFQTNFQILIIFPYKISIFFWLHEAKSVLVNQKKFEPNYWKKSYIESNLYHSCFWIFRHINLFLSMTIRSFYLIRMNWEYLLILIIIKCFNYQEKQLKKHQKNTFCYIFDNLLKLL